MATRETHQDSTSLTIPQAVESKPAHLPEQFSLPKEVMVPCCYAARKLVCLIVPSL